MPRRGGGGGVDVVHPDSGTTDDAKLRGVLQQGSVHLDGGADDEGVSVGECRGETAGLFGGEVFGGDDGEGGIFAQELNGGGGDFFGKDNFHDLR